MVVEVMKNSEASRASASVNGRSSTRNPAARASPITARRVMPSRIRFVAGWVTTRPSRTMNALDDPPSVTVRPSRTKSASSAPDFFALCLASTLARRQVVLRWHRPQRSSGTVSSEYADPGAGAEQARA
jgi:hypothetical protein